MAEWYLATYQNGVFLNKLGIIQPSGDYAYELKNGIQSTKSPVKSDWLRITIADNKVKKWVNSSWTEDATLTGLVNNSTCWVYGFIVKYIIVTNSQTYYLEDLTTLNTNDIDKNNITSITITNSVTEISENAFSGVNNVIFIIPEGVLTKLNEADPSPNLSYGIGKSFFFDASNATLVKDYPYYTIVTNSQVYYLESFSNRVTAKLSTITGKDINNEDVTIDSINITHVIIGNKVNTISIRAFNRFTSLASLTIGNSVTTIGERAFSGCSSLASLTIGNSVETIVYYAFSQCSSLASVNIPDSVETIDDGAFYQCSSLASLKIGEKVKSIGDAAFLGCSSLASVTIPDSVETIGDVAFFGINSDNDDEAIITISQNTVRSLMDDNTLPYTYTSGNKYTGETFFSDTTTVTLNVI